MKRKVGFYPRHLVQLLTRPHHIISIGEKGDGLQLSTTHHSILRLEFDDIYDPLEGYRLFSYNDTQRILSWLEELPEDCTFVIVHCEAGISRSAAVAQFMINHMDYELHEDPFSRNDFRNANPHVYGMLRRAHYERYHT